MANRFRVITHNVDISYIEIFLLHRVQIAIKRGVAKLDVIIVIYMQYFGLPR